MVIIALMVLVEWVAVRAYNQNLKKVEEDVKRREQDRLFLWHPKLKYEMRVWEDTSSPVR